MLNSLIPLGMIFGCAAGVLFGIFSSTSLIEAITLGASFGLLAGYFGYEYYSRAKQSHSR